MELIKMPRLGITMKSGTIANWLKEAGSIVRPGEELFELETEKSVVSVEAQGSGVLHVVVESGTEVPINTVIGVLAEPGEQVDLSKYSAHSQRVDTGPAENPQAQQLTQERSTSNNSRPLKVLPRVRKVASELGVDLKTVIGTGSGGEITEEDVRQAAARGASSADDEVLAVEPLNGIRKAMAENMAKSWSSIPQFTQMIEVDATQILNYVERARQSGEAIGITDIVVKVVSNVLKCSQDVNAIYDDGNLIRFRNIHIGIAVSTDKGLVVPVIRNVQELTLREVHDAVKETAEQARAGSLRPENYTGGSLTISNLGMYGIESGTPILNPGQSCLVFVGAIKQKVVFVDGSVAAHPVLPMAFTYDHRIIDGVQGAQFTNQVRKKIESFG